MSQDPFLAQVENETAEALHILNANDVIRERIKNLVITKTEFPLECLPQGVADFVRAYMDVFKVPADHYGLAILTAAGAAIGNAARINDRTTLHPAILNSVFVDVPGSGKTPTISTVLKPFVKIEGEHQRDHAQALHEWKEEQKAGKTNRGDDEENEEPPAPSEMLVGDFTLESLIDVLEFNARGVLAWADEIEGFIASMDKYRTGKGGDDKFWLSAYTGEAYKTNRRNRGRGGVYLPRVFCPFMGGIQPGLLTIFSDEKRDSSGFLSRLLFTIPPLAKKQHYHNQSPHPKHAAHWETCIRRLISVPPKETVSDFSGKELVMPHVVDMSDEARTIYAAFINGIADRINELDELDITTRSTLVKFETHLLRFALILHYLDWASKPLPFEVHDDNEFADALAEGYVQNHNISETRISGEAMTRATVLAEYFMATGLEVVGKLDSYIKTLPAAYQVWYEELPEENITTKIAVELGTTAGFSKSTVQRLMKSVKLFKKSGRGIFEKA
jgi:hypothetical protein